MLYIYYFHFVVRYIAFNYIINIIKFVIQYFNIEFDKKKDFKIEILI